MYNKLFKDGDPQGLGVARGKSLDNGEWVKGYHIKLKDPLIPDKICSYILEQEDTSDYDCIHTALVSRKLRWHEVDSGTVGMFTTLSDEEGKDIFCGDVVHLYGDKNSKDTCSIDYYALVTFIDGGFCAIDGTPDEYAFVKYPFTSCDLGCKVVGTIYDNPDLLDVLRNGGIL